MNENGASAALRAAAAAGTTNKLPELAKWLSEQEGITGRYVATDLCDAAASAATPEGDGGLPALLRELRGRPDSILAAFFTAPASGEIFELPGAVIGPAGELSAFAPTKQALAAWPADPSGLAVIARHPAQGRLGAVRTAAWLQTVLGAIGLASYARWQLIAPLASCPALGTAVYLSTPTGEPDPVDRAALAAPGPPPVSHLSELLTEPASRELVADATALEPSDLAQKRLTLAARWLQLAASAISTADALVSLGIALETIAGDESKGAIVERITKRAAIFLASGAVQDERSDVYYEELARAKKLYDLRSRAAHGQYDEWTEDQVKGDAGRDEFHRFVLDVTLAFRAHARERNMRDSADFKKWWQRAEGPEGLFC
jgi:hypothetical protein